MKLFHCHFWGKNNLEPDLNQLKDKITNRTKLIILNSPHNPIALFIPTIIREIFKLASEKNVYILSDEVYGRMVYPDTKLNFSLQEVLMDVRKES